MNWLNIEVKWLRSSEYLGSEPIERATWLSLMAYCADQENGGVIEGCRDWSDRRWQQTCGVTKEEAQLEGELWKWVGDDLIPWNYPVSKEAEIRAKRIAGAKGGRESKPPKTKAVKAVLEADPKVSGNGIGKERNRNRNKNKKVFVRPTIQEIEDFGKTLDPVFTEAHRFIDYYESNGWKVGRNPMRDWQSTVRNWHRKRHGEETNTPKEGETKDGMMFAAGKWRKIQA